MTKTSAITFPYTFSFKGKKTTLLWTTSEKYDYFETDISGKLIKFNGDHSEHQGFSDGLLKVRWQEGSNLDFDKFWSEIHDLSANLR